MSVTLTPSVDQTLEVLLTPGGKTRLSPLVQSAQLYFLTNTWPDDRRRHESIQAILKKQEATIHNLAEVWAKTRSQQFSEAVYQDIDYLKMYAAYYFSVNVGKLHILLQDLLRSGEIPEAIHAVDMGVGTGSTAVAILDFLYAWGIACLLHSQHLPIQQFSLICYDRSEQALNVAKSMVEAYGQAIERRKKEISATETSRPSLDLADKIYTWSKNITWQKVDVEIDPIPTNVQTNFLVLSNILNELHEKVPESNLQKYIQGLNSDALVVIIEPGDREKTKQLITWRESFLRKHNEFASILPCGQGYSPSSKNTPCEVCWAARRESFHQPLLYETFRQACSKFFEKQQKIDEHFNNLLSWSYCVFKKETAHKVTNERKRRHLIAGEILSEPVQVRVMGMFYKKTEANGKEFDLIDYPIDQNPYQSNSRNWDELYKICVRPFSETKFLALKRRAGYQIPKIRFGQEALVSNIRVEPHSNGSLSQFQLVPLDGNQTKIHPFGWHEPGKIGDGFLSEYDENSRNAVDEVANRLFGFPGMRPFQHEILGRVLCGKHVLGIAATGGGKSECFILPSMILPGVTIVISPLKSLMTDQYEQRLNRRFGLSDLATYINGDVPYKERQARLKRMEFGYYKLVYFTPEQLERDFILEALKRTNEAVGIRYLALDEAHCISQWGHDFRPSYLNIVRRLKKYSIHPVIIALTATASLHVRQDICEELNLNPLPMDQGGDVFVYSSNRPEINFVVKVMHTTDEKVNDILDELHQFQQDNQHNQKPGAALVFLPHTGGDPDNTWRYLPNKQNSRKGKYSAGVTGFASFLERTLNHRVAIYHGKMDRDDPETIYAGDGKTLGDLSGRRRIQEQNRFIDSATTGTDIMVATKGFGMGIDKPNIRLIIHRSPTANLEAYAQEAGRAGRDGDLATAILYYSPDSPEDVDDQSENVSESRKKKKIPSDHEIQKFFLSGKYIRREDVILMRAFLKQANHKLFLTGNATPYIYFTSDEVLDFFDTATKSPDSVGLITAFHWPDFELRESYAYESEEHKTILDKGHLYQQKTLYISRILAALYRIRPEIDGRIHQAFLESVQETGAKVQNGKIRKWENIYQSNAYFGEVFRVNNITEQDLAEALIADDLIGFAKKLNLSISETVALLNDIKFAEGCLRKNDWAPDLLDFSLIIAPLYGPATGKASLRLWREYAGASRRASKTEAEKRAINNRRANATLDDWFGWNEVTRRKGWEVLPGPAFDANFDQFLNAFMLLHDERKRNDWASYNRLLTDYIGVSEDGQIPREKGQNKCLRSVLLGHLESYEVVIDGNCFSCSACVPDGNFDRYPIELREKAIIRMSPDLISLFDEMKAQTLNIPEQSRIDLFISRLVEEQASGRSLYNYFSGWSGKLLNDEPGHLTAQWLRFIAMTKNILEMQPQEFLNLANSLVDNIPDQLVSAFCEMLELQRDTFKGDPNYLKVWAKIYRRNSQPMEEAKTLEQLFGYYYDQKNIVKEEIRPLIHRLLYLFDNKGPVPDREKFLYWKVLSGRIAASYSESLNEYVDAVLNFNWDQVITEISEQKRWLCGIYSQAALLVAWIGSNDERENTRFLGWVENHIEEVNLWPQSSLERIIPLLTDDLIIKSPTIIDLVLGRASEERFITLCFKCLALDGDLPQEQLKKLGELCSPISTMQNALNLYVPNISKQSIVLSRIIPYLRLIDIKDFQDWEKLFFKVNIARANVDIFAKNVIRQAATLPETLQKETVMGLTSAIIKYADNPQIRGTIIQEWSQIYIDYPFYLARILESLYMNYVPAAFLADPLLEIVLDKQIDVLPEIPTSAGYPRWQNAISMAKKIDQFTKYVRMHPGTHRIEFDHLQYLRDSFQWTEDPNESNMLVAILLELQKKVSPGWKTFLVLLIEILVKSGRADMAEEIGNYHTDLTISYKGQELNLQEFILKIKSHQRKDPIPVDYKKIAEKSLARF